MSDEEIRLKHLQKKCARALALYLDLSEAVCEIMIKSGSAPITAADRAHLHELRQQEVEALKDYLNVRLNLMTALSIEASPAFRKMITAVSATEPLRHRVRA